VLESAAVSEARVRQAAASGDELPPPLQGYVAAVRDAAWRTTDSDIAALKSAGYDEDEIFEVTVAAALGAALRSFGAGMDLLRERLGDAAGDP
jgi:alkylhydroperoxidase family enzyme